MGAVAARGRSLVWFGDREEVLVAAVLFLLMGWFGRSLFVVCCCLAALVPVRLFCFLFFLSLFALVWLIGFSPILDKCSQMIVLPLQC